MSIIDTLQDKLYDQVKFLFEDAGDSVFSIQGTNMAAIAVDTVDKEQHDWENDVSNFEVEGLEDIGDNIKPKPDEISFTCFVSNTPVHGLIDQVTHFADRFLNGRNRTQLTFNALADLRRLRVPVRVVTRYRQYDNMAVQSIRIVRQPEDGEALIFDVSFKKLNIVKTQTAKVPPGLGKGDTASTKQRAGVKTDAGKSNGKTTTPAKAPAQVKRSALKAMSGGDGYTPNVSLTR